MFLLTDNDFVMPVDRFVDRDLFCHDRSVKVFVCECYTLEDTYAIGCVDSDTAKRFGFFYLIGGVVGDVRARNGEERVFSSSQCDPESGNEKNGSYIHLLYLLSLSPEISLSSKYSFCSFAFSLLRCSISFWR